MSAPRVSEGSAETSEVLQRGTCPVGKVWYSGRWRTPEQAARARARIARWNQTPKRRAYRRAYEKKRRAEGKDKTAARLAIWRRYANSHKGLERARRAVAKYRAKDPERINRYQRELYHRTKYPFRGFDRLGRDLINGRITVDEYARRLRAEIERVDEQTRRTV